MKIKSLAIAALVLTLGCDSVNEPSPSVAETQESVLAVNDQFNDIAENLDKEGFLELYDEDSLWISPTEGPVAGLGLPDGTFQFLVDNDGVISHTAEHVFVSGDGELAVLIGEYDLAVEAVGAEAAGTYLYVLDRNQEGSWVIRVDMFNEYAS